MFLNSRYLSEYNLNFIYFVIDISFVMCIQTGTNFTELNHRIVEPVDVSMNLAHRKRYRDRDRYLQMTPIQREAYLQRNREYKRAKRDNNASSSSADSTNGQAKMSYNEQMHMLQKSSQVTQGNFLVAYNKHNFIITTYPLLMEYLFFQIVACTVQWSSKKNVLQK
jgi:hypothetical protein